MPLGEHHGEKNAEEGKHGSYGQIDTSRHNHDSHAYTEDSVGTDQATRVSNVRGAEELRIQQGNDDTKRNKQRQNTQLFSHQATASLMIASCVQPEPSRMPVTRPSCMTATRSLLPSISSMSLLIIRMATPSAARRRIR